MVLQLFEKIASIPHCSGDTEQLASFIQDFATSKGYRVQRDRAGNILCFRNARSIALQAHYDMVCVGTAPNIEIIEENGYLRAQNSSLGADNGIGVAIMLSLMEEGKEAEFLFTNDEEVGLIGANALELELKADKMINLDSEEFGAIFVGCAGGVDIYAQGKFDKRFVETNFFEVSYQGAGGHSGVDIDKNIPNAIKELAFYIKENRLNVSAFNGGERINSIPAHAYAIVCGAVKEQEGIKIKSLGRQKRKVFEEKFIDLLLATPSGVLGYDRELLIPTDSQNLALVEADEEVEVSVSARSMSERGLVKALIQNSALFEGFGLESQSSGKYPPWEPQIGPFAKEVKRVYDRFSQEVHFKAIHAGLEAAILSKKFPHMQIISIGPNIINPHSTSERVEIATIEPIYKIVKELL